MMIETSSEKDWRCPEPFWLRAHLLAFREFGRETIEISDQGPVPVFVNEFWTSKQRAAHRLHEISYRACFKPQLPRFFIERLTRPGEVVYDPFMGRGTTLLEAALLGRKPSGGDLNPLSPKLLKPRLKPPSIKSVEDRLDSLDLENGSSIVIPEALLVFYHPVTLRAICMLREYLLMREKTGFLDEIDEWIRMIAVNRLTGHSSGFFSVYTLPPNQATSVKAQTRINEKRNQVPPLRDVKRIILKKSRSLLTDSRRAHNRPGQLDCFYKSDIVDRHPSDSQLFVQSADEQTPLNADSVSLVVTSPPFLNEVNYAEDNWLRGWFCGFDTKSLNLTITGSLPVWSTFIHDTLVELKRILKPGRYIAFEVGEVRKGKVKLESTVVEQGIKAGLEPVLVMINDQNFTKTAQCWGVDNQEKGTNTNRIVLFRKVFC